LIGAFTTLDKKSARISAYLLFGITATFAAMASWRIAGTVNPFCILHLAIPYTIA